VPEPEVVAFRHPAASDEPKAMLPQFPQVAAFIDHFARRIPWWAWVAGTVALLWWSGRKNGRRPV